MVRNGKSSKFRESLKFGLGKIGPSALHAIAVATKISEALAEMARLDLKATRTAGQSLQRKHLMTIPLWVLLGFAGWTLIVLFGTIGVYRWSRILTGRMRVAEWQADTAQGSEWYRRAMRAHINCVENLPVYGAIVVCATAAGARSGFLDALALAFMAARICQTTVHLAFTQTDFVASVRFAFFFVQALCMVAMGISVAATAAAG